MTKRYEAEEASAGFLIRDKEQGQVVLNLATREVAEAIASVLNQVPGAEPSEEFIRQCAIVFQRTRGNPQRTIEIIQAEQEARGRAGMRINERFTPRDHGRLELATRWGRRS